MATVDTACIIILKKIYIESSYIPDQFCNLDAWVGYRQREPRLEFPFALPVSGKAISVASWKPLCRVSYKSGLK